VSISRGWWNGPRKVTREDLTRAARAALGSERKIRELTRLAGGTTKGVYRLAMADGTTAIAYLWEGSENYWPQAPNENDGADPFPPGTASACSQPRTVGSLPQIYLLDRSHAHYSDIAILEDFPGENLLVLWERARSRRNPRWPGCARHWRRCAAIGAAHPAR
jgi:hypothetical protein